MTLALGRHWRDASRHVALISNSARCLRTAPSRTQTSFCSTTRLDPPSKGRVGSRGGLLLIQRYHSTGSVCTGFICRPRSRASSTPVSRTSAALFLSMSQQRSSSTNTSKGDDAKSAEKSAECDQSHKHNDHAHSHSIFHSHSHGDDHDHSQSAEQIVHVFEGKGALSFAGCSISQHVRYRRPRQSNNLAWASHQCGVDECKGNCRLVYAFRITACRRRSLFEWYVFIVSRHVCSAHRHLVRPVG